MSELPDGAEPPDESDALSDSNTGLALAELQADACLLVVSGPSSGRVYQLISGETIIGRATQADIRVDEKAVSGRHAKLVRQGRERVLVDLGSTNGTFLNGQRLSPDNPRPLAFGDTVQVAETVFAYLPSRTDTQEQTHLLSKLLPEVRASAALRLSDASAVGQWGPRGGNEEPPAPSLEEQVAKVMRVLRLLRRNWVPLFAGTALCALLGNATVFINPPPSEANFKIRISPPQKDDRSRNDDPDNQQFYTVAEQNFVSAQLIESTLRSLGKKKPSPDQVAALRKELKLEPAEFITYLGKYQHEDPEYAVRFLKHHLSGFLALEIRRTLHVIQAETDFLNARVKEREGELARTEDELKEFKRKHLEGLPESTSGHLASRETLLARRAELSGQLSRTNLELNLARSRLTQEAPILSKKVASGTPYEQSKAEVQRKLAEARSKGLGEAHPEVVALKAQSADLDRLAQQARTTNASELERESDPRLLELRHRVGDLDVASRGTGAELGEINALLARLDSIVSKMPEVEARYSQLTRSYTVNKEMHARLFEQLRANQLKLELERTSATVRYEVITPPESMGVPLKKALVMRTMVGAVIGLAIGILIAALMELRRALRERSALRSAAIVRVGGFGGPLARR